MAAEASGAGSATPFRLGIIGASLRGLVLGLRMEQESGATVVGVADPSPEALALARQHLGQRPAVYAASDAELFERAQCDAVYIASGDPYHVQNAEVALRNGAHIFLEKPLAQTMTELQRLVWLWERSDRVLMAGLELRQCVVFQEMRRLLDAGAIGRVVMGMAVDNVSVGGMYFYHNRYRRRSYVRSLVLQKGSHTLDLLNWFMGCRPRRVFALGGMNVFGQGRETGTRCRDCTEIDTCRYAVKQGEIELDYATSKRAEDVCVYARGADVDDNSLVLIDYGPEARAFYGESHFTPEYTREFTLIGTAGKMTGFYNNDCEFTVTVTRRERPQETQIYRPRPTVNGGHGGSDVLALREFGRRVRVGDRAEAEFRQVVEGAAIAIAATDAAETGQPVPIPF